MCAIVWLPFKVRDQKVINSLKDSMYQRGTCSFGLNEGSKTTLLHSRFSTNGIKGEKQPFRLDQMSICFNGQVFDWKNGEIRKLRESLSGHSFNNIEQAKFHHMGSFSITIKFSEGAFCQRDSYGRRPLYLVKKNQSYMVASEAFILSVFDYDEVEELSPGEWVKLNNKGEIFARGVNKVDQKLCFLEKAYFMNRSSKISGKELSSYRFELGKKLGDKIIEKDLTIVPIPSSANDFARGLALQKGCEVSYLIKKEKFRTFIEGEDRDSKIKSKYSFSNKIPKRILLVDDSVISGKTIDHIVGELRNKGAEQIYLAVGTPKIRNRCLLGMGFINKKDVYYSDREFNTNLNGEYFLDIQDYEESFDSKFCNECS